MSTYTDEQLFIDAVEQMQPQGKQPQDKLEVLWTTGKNQKNTIKRNIN